MNESMDVAGLIDHYQIEQLCARYAEHLSRHEVDDLVGLFTPDAVYAAFGNEYTMEHFPGLVESAPRGQLLVNPPVVTLDGDTGTGTQHYAYIDQKSHEMRLAWYTDAYQRTADGWRFARRSTTFMRRSGAADKGRSDDPSRYDG